MTNDTFYRIQVRAMAMVQNTSRSITNANDLLPKVKDWTRTRYDRVMRAFPWTEITKNYSLSVAVGTTDYSLRYDLDSIIKVWDATHGQEITQVELQDYVRFTQPNLEVVGNVQSGQIDNYVEIGSRAVAATLSIADQVQVVSTSASDITPMVIRIQGEVSGVLVAENITLTGTSAATSVNTYDAGVELIVSAGTSNSTLQDLVGVVTVREKTTTTNVLAKLAPNERSPYYKWVRFTPTPSTATSVNIWYKRRWMPLTNDNDVPLIPCANEIIEGIVADALWEDGQEGAASAQESKFTKVVTELWFARRPRNLITQMTPETYAPDGMGFYPYYVGNTYQ